MKYFIMRVCYGSKDSGIKQLVPIIFPNQMIHEEVYTNVKSLYERFGPVEVVSAGEISIGDVLCSGNSSTLQVTSREIVDDLIISTFDYMHGIEGGQSVGDKDGT